jgi:hypothetical protein
MGDAFSPEPQGAFLSALDWLDKPGQVVRNTLKGNFAGALRNLGDFGLDAIDAFLPGDWIPELAGEEDKVSGSDLIGLDKEEHPVLGFLGDVGIGTLTDPLTYLTFGASAALKGAGTAAKVGIPFTKAAVEIPGSAKAIGAAKGAVKAGYGMLPKGARTYAENAALATKDTLGWLNPAPKSKQALATGTALRSRATRAGQAEAERIMGALPENLQVMVGDVIDNLRHGDDGVKVLRPEPGRASGAIESIDQQIRNLRERMMAHPEYAGLDDATRSRLDSVIADSIKLSHTQYLDDLKHGAMAKPKQYTDASGQRFMQDDLKDVYKKETGLEDVDPGRFDDYVKGRGLTMQEVDVTNASPRNYLARMYEKADDAEAAAMGSGTSALKSRKYRTDEELAAALNDPASGKTYERNAYKRLLTRSQQQGRMLEKATIARHVLGDRFKNLVDGVYKTTDNGGMIYDKSVNAAVDEALETMAKTDPESARALANMYKGMEARGPVLELLAKANRYFKPAAVYGVIIPKMGSIVRNDLGTSWQILSEQGPKAALNNLGRSPRRMWDSINDGLVKAFGLKRIKPGEITNDIALIEQAFAQSRGAEAGVMQFLEGINRPDLAEAVRHNVLEGFVSTEEIMKKSAGSPWWKQKFFDIYDAPSAIFQGVELRARLGNFLEQLRGGRPGAESAQLMRDSLLDYQITSSKNRTLRDIIPFAAFASGSVRQQSKFLAKNPAMAVGLSQVMQDRGDPVYPWMEGKTNIPIGSDEQGEDQYITGLGLPFEALNMVPNLSDDLGNFGRDVQKNLVGSSHPLLKSAFAAVSGEDPYFETPYGSYDKIPGIGSAGDVGRAYNKLAGTGLIQPIDSILRLLGDATDERHGVAERLADTLTGINIASVDPDLALQQQLQQELMRNPDILRYQSFYSPHRDPEAIELMQQYQDAKGRVKAKRGASDFTDQARKAYRAKHGVEPPSHWPATDSEMAAAEDLLGVPKSKKAYGAPSLR